ncbi:hypothetical protein O3P69_008679 [Scylla paramamosain]|uniref:BTB domain-containing protein n=1 Tax=Scylla paramamosain TaxID=85552 RepID=A0AAW0SN22_SCYPA
MADGMLSLSWNNHSTTFTHTLATLREKERYTDVTLSCEGRFYPVHKLVLSTCSEYFMRMFELTPCKHPVVVLQDVQCKEMEALLSYMYAGVVSVAQSDLPQLIKVAEALQIKGLAVPDENLCSNMKYSPYSREGDVSSGQRGNKKDQIVVPRVTPKLEHKSENRNNKQTNSRSFPRTDYSKSSYRLDRDHTDDHKDLSDEGHDRYLDTDDENSSEMQEVLPVSLVKVEVKDEEDDEHIDVDDTGYDSKHESNQPLPLLVPKREPIEDYRSMSSGSERRSLHYSPWQALREAH